MELKGWNVSEAASEIGLSEPYIHYLLSLVEAPNEIKQLVEEKKIDPSTAGEIIYRLKDKPEKAVEVVKKKDKKEKIGVFRILAYARPKGDKNLLSSLQASYCA
jgi:hydroxymethylpyrimidine pyrophosphatase-like HAD family hydrolase